MNTFPYVPFSFLISQSTIKVKPGQTKPRSSKQLCWLFVVSWVWGMSYASCPPVSFQFSFQNSKQSTRVDNKNLKIGKSGKKSSSQGVTFIQTKDEWIIELVHLKNISPTTGHWAPGTALYCYQLCRHFPVLHNQCLEADYLKIDRRILIENLFIFQSLCFGRVFCIAFERCLKSGLSGVATTNLDIFDASWLHTFNFTVCSENERGSNEFSFTCLKKEIKYLR